MKISKVVVCGTKHSGKTSILEQAIYGNFGPFQETHEDIYEVNVETERGGAEHIRLYDTEGIDTRKTNVPGSTVQDQVMTLSPFHDFLLMMFFIIHNLNTYVLGRIR